MSSRSTIAPRDRFLGADRYRVRREWQRYEGTAQRAAFRQLRARFLARHRGPKGWAADLGSGPGRFTDDLGSPGSSRVMLDLSTEAFRLPEAEGRPIRKSTGVWHRVVGDASRPPLRDQRFGTVALLGNLLGFAEAGWPSMLASAARLVAPGGTLVVEVAPGPGERSRYLTRLPPTAAARVMGSPRRWVLGRVNSEGFDRLPSRKKAADRRFSRIRPESLMDPLSERGFARLETMAVAPMLGAEPDRLERIAVDPLRWERFLEIEEEVGRAPTRIEHAAACLVAFERRSP